MRTLIHGYSVKDVLDINGAYEATIRGYVHNPGNKTGESEGERERER